MFGRLKSWSQQIPFKQGNLLITFIRISKHEEDSWICAGKVTDQYFSVKITLEHKIVEKEAEVKDRADRGSNFAKVKKI